MIKRYEPAMFQFPEGMKEGMAERVEGNYVMYADIAPLEAKAAMFDELVSALDMTTDYISTALAHERAAFKGYEHASHIPSILTDSKTVDDLLTRARAMEG